MGKKFLFKSAEALGLLILGYVLSYWMYRFWPLLQDATAHWPLWPFQLSGIGAAIGTYLLVAIAGDGASNSRTYQWLLLIAIGIYAFACIGDYSAIALLSCGPLFVASTAALIKATTRSPLRIKNSRRLLTVAVLSAMIGILASLFWSRLFAGNLTLLWITGGLGLSCEAIAQITYTQGWINPRVYRRMQTLASLLVLISNLAQSSSGSVAYNVAVLSAMVIFALDDRFRLRKQ